MKMFRFNFYHTRKENFFNNNNAEQSKGLIGYLRGDFGRNGNEFYTSWFDKNEKLNKEPFKTEFNDVMNFLRERLLTDRAYMRSFVYGNEQLKLDTSESNSHGMFVESENYEYDIRTISDSGNYDFYIYCYDKRFQKPQYLNAKRFRDEYGKLTERVEEIARKTLPEAHNYYIDGDRYENEGKIYTFKVTDENMMFEGADGTKLFIAPEMLGTYLPDIASVGNSFSKVPLDQTLSNITLGDLLKGVSLSSVHIVHNEVDHDLATIEDLSYDNFSDEGRIEWADVLAARVEQIYEGSYGLQIQCSNVECERLEEFSKALAGYCPAEDWDNWFNNESEQEQNMKM